VLQMIEHLQYLRYLFCSFFSPKLFGCCFVLKDSSLF